MLQHIYLEICLWGNILYNFCIYHVTFKVTCDITIVTSEYNIGALSKSTLHMIKVIKFQHHIHKGLAVISIFWALGSTWTPEHHSQVSDVKSLALHVTSINLVSLERGSIAEYVFLCFQLGKLDLDVTWPWFWRSLIFSKMYHNFLWNSDEHVILVFSLINLMPNNWSYLM